MSNPTTISGMLDAKGLKIAILATRFNDFIVDRLTGGALVPLLSLGIPGDSTTAVLIGAFMLQGIQVGPLFITNNPVIWNTILVALLCCNILMYLCNSLHISAFILSQ